MSKNNCWVLILNGEEPEIFTSWEACKTKMETNASRAIYYGFTNQNEAEKFIAGKWRTQLSEELSELLEKYKRKPEDLIQDTELDTPELLSDELPKHCAYVDGSFNSTEGEGKERYGFGVVFVCDGEIVGKFYGGGNDENLKKMGCGAGELLACMEAIKHAHNILNWEDLTIIYDSQLIKWAYYGTGEKELTQIAGQYMYDIREAGMEIKVKSIEGLSHPSKKKLEKREEDPGNLLADKLAKKGAGLL